LLPPGVRSLPRDGAKKFVESFLQVSAVAFDGVEFGSEAVIAFADPTGSDLLSLEFLLGSP